MADPTSGKNGMSHSQETWEAWAISVPCCSATAAAASPACSAWARFALSTGRMVMRSLAEEVRLLDVDGPEGLAGGQNDGEPDGGLGRRQHDHEGREHLPRELPRPFDVMVEGDEVHVRSAGAELESHGDA